MDWFKVGVTVIGTLVSVVTATIMITRSIGAFKKSIKQDIDKGINDLKDYFNSIIVRVENRIGRAETQIDMLNAHLLDRKSAEAVAKDKNNVQPYDPSSPAQTFMEKEMRRQGRVNC